MTQADWERNRTRNSLANAELYGQAADGFRRFLEGVENGGGLLDEEWTRENYNALCSFLASALALPVPPEPEMAAVIEELQRLRDEHREWLA